jgi:predicted enzyme related to lactoylglutathione lyase
MKLKSGAGIVCYVKDISKSVDFYETLGFEFKRKESTRATAYEINASDVPPGHVSPNTDNKNIGALFYFSVDNVQKAYDELTSRGIKPSSEPADLRGNKEFLITDPDGYRLVFFKRK